jgi:hypothetical protein
MTTQTIARLFKIAANRIMGEDGSSAILYLGNALAARALMPDDDFTAEYAVIQAKKCFRMAKLTRKIQPRRPVRSSGGCCSSECEGAYLMTE